MRALARVMFLSNIPLFWIRVFNIPIKSMNKAIGTHIAKEIGIPLLVDASKSGLAWGPFLLIRVDIDITKPLMRGWCRGSYKKINMLLPKWKKKKKLNTLTSKWKPWIHEEVPWIHKVIRSWNPLKRNRQSLYFYKSQKKKKKKKKALEATICLNSKINSRVARAMPRNPKFTLIT